MAEFTEVMKRKSRMCDTFHQCDNCPLSLQNNKIEDCSSFMEKYPQEAEKIIMDWAKEHPVKTNADKFLEVFGVPVKTDSCSLDVDCLSRNGCHKCEYNDFWKREYKENGKDTN